MKRLPFRVRIALLSAAVSGAVLVAFGLLSLYIVYQQRVQAVDREIRTLSARHPGWFGNRGNYERLSSVLNYTFGEQRKEQVALLIANPAGRVLFQSAHWPTQFLTFENIVIPPPAPSEQNSMPTNQQPVRGGFGRGYGMGMGPPDPSFETAPRFVTKTAGRAKWRFGGFQGSDTTLVFGMSLNAIWEELQPLRKAFLITFPIALIIVGFGGWVVSGLVLRPIGTIAETAEQVTARGLDRRIPHMNEAPELGRVIDVLNRMMDRLQASFHQAIRFSADASHELKTPLTVMQGELENAVQTAPSGSSEQQMLNGLLEQTQRLKSITRTLLLLAQADGKSSSPRKSWICLTSLWKWWKTHARWP
jgi:HAMP domain-containing protein